MAEFKNPNQPGGSSGSQDSRSLLVMMVVMFGVIFGLQIWRAKHNPQTAAPSSPLGDNPAASRGTQQPAAPLGGGSPHCRRTRTADGDRTAAVQAGAESTTIVENDLYRITF